MGSYFKFFRLCAFVFFFSTFMASCDVVTNTQSTPQLYPRPDRASVFYEYDKLTTDLNAKIAQSAHFSIWSTLPDQTLTLMLQDLENLRIALLDFHNIDPKHAEHPIDIILIDDPDYFEAFSPGHSLAGFYENGALGPVIIIRTVDMKLDPNAVWSTLYHEYAHHFHATFLPYKVPLWLNEGFAEYASSFRRTETGYGLGLYEADRIESLHEFSSDWLDTNELVKTLDHYPYIPGYVGEAAKKRTLFYYDQSWLLAFWLLQSDEGQDTLQRLINNLDSGKSIQGVFPDTIHEDLLSYADSFEPYPDTHFLPDTSFPEVRPKIETITQSEFLGRIFLQMRFSGISSNISRGLLDKFDNDTSNDDIPDPVKEMLRVHSYLALGLEKEALDTIEAARKSENAYSAFSRLYAQYRLYLYESVDTDIYIAQVQSSLARHRSVVNDAIKFAISKRSGDFDLDILYVRLLGRNAYNLSPNHKAVLQRILDSGHHKRNPFLALDLVYPLISINEFDEAEAIIARARLWDPQMNPLNSNRLDEMVLDIQAYRDVFAEQSDQKSD